MSVASHAASASFHPLFPRVVPYHCEVQEVLDDFTAHVRRVRLAVLTALEHVGCVVSSATCVGPEEGAASANRRRGESSPIPKQ